MKQPSFAGLAYYGKEQTRKEKFLADMDRIIAWQKLTRQIEPCPASPGCTGPGHEKHG